MRRVSHIGDAPHGVRHVLSFLICLLVLKSYLCQVMNRYSDLLPRCLRWLLRFRHRCGYGIHSPFAFGFVTGVIYESGQYYAYAPLHRCFQEQKAADGLRECDLRLLFRVANASGASSVWLSSSGSPLVEQKFSAEGIRPSARKHCRRRLIFFMPMQVEFPPNFLKWQYAVPVRKPFLFFVA